MTAGMDVLTPKQVARLLGLHYQTVLGLIKDGTLRASKIGERYLIQRKWIDEMLEATSERKSA